MIRIALLEDVPAIQLITKLSLEYAYDELLSKEVQEKFLNEHYSQEAILKRIEESTMLMLESEAGTIAFTTYTMDSERIHIQALYVLPQYQRIGSGTKMLEYLIDLSTSTNKELSIDLESRNMVAQKFYAKHDFELDHNYPFDLYGQPLKRSLLVRKVK